MNCLALQAVVDRWTNMPNEAAGSEGLSLKVLMTQYEVNEPYIREVVDASRKILQIVLDGLVPGNYLRHTPVRTFFRIMSGMIFILKVGAQLSLLWPMLICRPLPSAQKKTTSASRWNCKTAQSTPSAPASSTTSTSASPSPTFFNS